MRPRSCWPVPLGRSPNYPWKPSKVEKGYKHRVLVITLLIGMRGNFSSSIFISPAVFGTESVDLPPDGNDFSPLGFGVLLSLRRQESSSAASMLPWVSSAVLHNPQRHCKENKSLVSHQMYK